CEKTWNTVGQMARPAGLQATEPTRENHPVVTRRRMAWAIAASVLLAVALWNVQAVNRLQRLMTDHRTAVGEQRLVTLKDESTILLNTDSAVDVGYSSTVREIHLIRGEAAVTVAPDPARPLSVIMPDLTATALGTQFVVKTVSGRSTVTVLEHAVRVVPNRSPPTGAVTVETGQRTRLLQDEQLVVDTVDLEQAAAWRHGKLIFDGQPLEQLLDELDRYRTGRILLLNRSLRAHKVTGVFPLRDGDAALGLLQQASPLRVVRLGPLVVLH
ncbi:MAG: FecR domain-containing protein, partial [Verrucomicrobiae bacterium]|nr:FecR domain-containing protein [Verrucomicrobiae bacterium]